MKVFIIGSHKTGTTTMERCLIKLGFNMLPRGIGYQNIIHEVNKNYEKFRPFIEKYDGFQDSPWCHNDLYKWIHKNYPDSKFILTTRDTQNWLDSFIRWTTQYPFIRTKDFWKYISKSCYGVNDLIEHHDVMISKYEARNKEIIEYFKGNENFMEFDIENNNGWKQLCNFLNVDVINGSFPHLNKTKK